MMDRNTFTYMKMQEEIPYGIFHIGLVRNRMRVFHSVGSSLRSAQPLFVSIRIFPQIAHGIPPEIPLCCLRPTGRVL